MKFKYIAILTLAAGMASCDVLEKSRQIHGNLHLLLHRMMI